MALNRDLREFLALLVQNDVRFLLVGAHALAVHGFARHTEDIDFWIARSNDNAEKVLKTLDQFGFGGLGLTVEDLMDPKAVVMLGRVPNRIDLLTFLTGLEFEPSYERRFECTFEGQPVSVISVEDLLHNKRMTAREKDLMDVKAFESARTRKS